MEVKIAELMTLFAQFTSATSVEIAQLRAQVDALRDENAKLKEQFAHLEKRVIVGPTSKGVAVEFRPIEKAIGELVTNAPWDAFEDKIKERIKKKINKAEMSECIRIAILEKIITYCREHPEEYVNILPSDEEDGCWCNNQFSLSDHPTILGRYFREDCMECTCKSKKHKPFIHIPEWSKMILKHNLHKIVVI